MQNLFLVRHGQSVGNIDKSKYFTTLDCDIELTKVGEEQCVEAGSKILSLFDFKNVNDIHVYHSPYLRAIQTKNIIVDVVSSKIDSKIHQICSPILRERHWGGLRDIVQMGQKTESHFNFFYKPPADGESFADCYQRCVLFDMMLKSSDVENAIVVSHGEWIRLYMMYFLNWSPEQFNLYKNPKNCDVYHIKNGKLSEETKLRMKPQIND
jgi:broad specificity phosphatase PhoE